MWILNYYCWGANVTHPDKKLLSYFLILHPEWEGGTFNLSRRDNIVKPTPFLMGLHKHLLLLYNYIDSVVIAKNLESLYILLLSDLTLAVPVANSLTFVATALCGWAVGEQLPHRSKWKDVFLGLWSYHVYISSQLLNLWHSVCEAQWKSYSCYFNFFFFLNPSHQHCQSGGLSNFWSFMN